MLALSVSARPRLKGQEFIQFDTMRKSRATHSLLWTSSSGGIAEGSAFAGGFAKNKATKCPMQSNWFTYFLQDGSSNGLFNAVHPSVAYSTYCPSTSYYQRASNLSTIGTRSRVHQGGSSNHYGSSWFSTWPRSIHARLGGVFGSTSIEVEMVACQSTH